MSEQGIPFVGRRGPFRGMYQVELQITGYTATELPGAECYAIQWECTYQGLAGPTTVHHLTTNRPADEELRHLLWVCGLPGSGEGLNADSLIGQKFLGDVVLGCEPMFPELRLHCPVVKKLAPLPEPKEVPA